MIDLKSMLLPEMEEYFRTLGLPKFRSRQVFSWLHAKRVSSFEEMTDLPAGLRQQLAGRSVISSKEETLFACS